MNEKEFGAELSYQSAISVIKSLFRQGLLTAERNVHQWALGIHAYDEGLRKINVVKYTVDPISKKRHINRGELPQYWVPDTHEAIISQETYRKVQDEIARRRQ